MVTELSTSELRSLRLASLRLSAPEASPRDVVRHLLAMQAQDFAAATWAIGVRCTRATVDDVRSSLDAGEIVRSWPLRGTLHFVVSEDLGWMLSLTSPRTLAASATRFAQLGLDQSQIARASEIVASALAGGNALGRAEVLAILSSNGVAVDGQRGTFLIFAMAQAGLVCWGPTFRNQQALVLCEEWIRHPRRLDRDEALRELAVRYFEGHGPATIRDFTWWGKLTLGDARTGVRLAGPDLVELSYRDQPVYISAASIDGAHLPTTTRRVYALAGFDEYLLGYQDRSAVLAARHAPRVAPGANGIFLPTLVGGGEVLGTWRKRLTASSVAVTAEPFRPLTSSERASFAVQARRYARFLGVELDETHE